MFDPHLKSTGREYTMTVAWLAIAVIFIPAAYLAVRPGGPSLLLTFICSMICAVMAWVSWRRSSQLTIPSIAVRKTRRND